MSETKVGVECGVALTLWLALILPTGSATVVGDAGAAPRRPTGFENAPLSLRLESDPEVFAALVREASP